MSYSKNNDSAVRKALKILNLYNSPQQIWRINEITDKLNYSKSTVSRIVQDLVSEGLLTPF